MHCLWSVFEETIIITVMRWRLSLWKHITHCTIKCIVWAMAVLLKALLWNTDVSITHSEWCVTVFFLSEGDFILDQWRSKCGCRGGGTWPITLGTKEEIFLTLPGGRFWNQARISGAYPLCWKSERPDWSGDSKPRSQVGELTAPWGVLTCWVAAAPWHGPAAQRLWMPLWGAPVPLPRRERDPGEMHPEDTQKDTHWYTFPFKTKHYLQYVQAALPAFQYASWVLFKNTFNPGVTATRGNKWKSNVSPVYCYQKEEWFYSHGTVTVGDWGIS